MTKFIVVIFPDETKADEGSSALEALHTEGRVTVYHAAVLVKDADGKASVRREKGQGPLAAGVAALVGGLIGLIGGPAVAALGAAAGAVSGGWLDALKLGTRADFLNDVCQKLTPGKSAVVAEVSEDRRTPLDMRMEAIGGVVIREQRPDMEEDRIEKEVEAEKAALVELEAEYAEAEREIRTRLDARIAETREKLKGATERALARLDDLEKETDAKVAVLEQQAARASADLKAQIERRVAEVRAEYDRRAAKLQQACELTKGPPA